MKKVALITGITGQDGSYLAEFLLEKGYDVYGMHRRSSMDNHQGRIEHLRGRIKLVCADMLDFSSLEKMIKEIKPDEIYNLASQSHVRISFDQRLLTKETNLFGVEKLLDLMEEYVPEARFYQASTSEMFGNAEDSPQNENTPFKPVSPYGVAKSKAHEALKRAREKGLFVCGGILFNHESPRRGLEFVTRKFTDGIARIKLGLPQRETGKSYLELGNLDARRDWGYAKDYVEAMWLMLQQDEPEDFVIATNETYSIRDFIEIATSAIGIEVTWKGEGLNEEGFDQNGEKIIGINEKFFRPSEIHELKGDSSKAKEVLGWEPKTKFEDLVRLMVESDLRKIGEIRM
jgi:GDPmannose 4,6-dehydratase